MMNNTKFCLLVWGVLVLLVVTTAMLLHWFNQPVPAQCVSARYPIPQTTFYVKVARWAEQPPLRYRY